MRTHIVLGAILLLALSAASNGQSTAADFFSHGLERGKAKDADGAIADYTRAIELDPKMAAAYVNRAKALNDKGDYVGAIADSTTAIELGHPEIYLAYYHRGFARRRTKDLSGAISDFTKALELKPTHDLTLIGRAAARVETADYDGAIEDYTKLLAVTNNSPRVYVWRGKVRWTRADYEEAVVDFTEAIKLAPASRMHTGTERIRGECLRIIRLQYRTIPKRSS